MLGRLTIRDFAVIDQVDIEWSDGLCVLTGETGAGKSILLDALGLALGRRGEARFVRADAPQASVTALFDLPDAHPASAILNESGLVWESPLMLRRVIGRDGRSRAFINDQPATIALLSRLGDALLEIHGQNDRIGLLDPATHRETLDHFGKAQDLRATVQARFTAWQDANATLAAAREAHTDAARSAAELRAALDELEALDPKPGEDHALAQQRAMLQDAETITTAISEAGALLSGDHPIDAALHGARRHLAAAGRRAGDALDDVLAAVDRASIEVGEAIAELDRVAHSLNLDPSQLDSIEKRLFALRGAARRHDVTPDDLPTVQNGLSAKLEALEHGDTHLAALETAVSTARAGYEEAARKLTKAREKAAKALDRAVNSELDGLMMGKARFTTQLVSLPTDAWTGAGAERVQFEVATNPGAAPGPLQKIASGGELSRFMLALKVALADVKATDTLVFDEVDAGIGGATADAVGARLARLGQTHQVLVVTHQPQVAGRGRQHYRVTKDAGKNSTHTIVEHLAEAERREEIARMIAGAEVTEEARAAASQLITGSAV